MKNTLHIPRGLFKMQNINISPLNVLSRAGLCLVCILSVITLTLCLRFLHWAESKWAGDVKINTPALSAQESTQSLPSPSWSHNALQIRWTLQSSAQPRLSVFWWQICWAKSPVAMNLLWGKASWECQPTRQAPHVTSLWLDLGSWLHCLVRADWIALLLLPQSLQSLCMQRKQWEPPPLLQSQLLALRQD